MSGKLLTEYHLEFLSLKEGLTWSSESTPSKCHIVENHVSHVICTFPITFSHNLDLNVLPYGNIRLI